MNRNFGKLNGDNIEYAPNALRIGELLIFNPSAAHYAQAGYLPVENNPAPPDAPEEQHYEFRSYEVADGAIRRVYELVDDPPPPPRTFVTADLVEALMAEGVWEQARAWIVERGMLDLVLVTAEFTEENENFKAGRAALQTALGWTDEQVEGLLSKCVKEGV